MEQEITMLNLFNLMMDVKSDVKVLGENLHEEIQQVREDLHEEIQQVREDLHEEIQQVRIDLGAEMKGMRSEIQGLRYDIIRLDRRVGRVELQLEQLQLYSWNDEKRISVLERLFRYGKKINML